jgi:hypothetical protein
MTGLNASQLIGKAVYTKDTNRARRRGAASGAVRRFPDKHIEIKNSIKMKTSRKTHKTTLVWAKISQFLCVYPELKLI